MNHIIRLLTQVYSLLLHLYPSQFRTEFAEEMQHVFEESVNHARADGRLAVIALCVRELCDLPLAIWRAHRYERSQMSSENNQHISWRELLVTLTPYIMFISIFILLALRIYLPETVGFAILAIWGVLVLAGLAKGLPRWSLPTLGLVLAIANLVISSGWWWNKLWGDLFRGLPSFWRIWIDSASSSFGILGLTLCLILIVVLIKPFRPFFWRVHEDWTLLPFTLYGIMPAVILFGFDEYHGIELYAIGIFGILMMGAWVYLRCSRKWYKILTLGLSITCALVCQSITRLILLPSQPWVEVYHITPSQASIWQEVTNTAYGWTWIMIIVFLPALIGLLPQAPRPSQPAP